MKRNVLLSAVAFLVFGCCLSGLASDVVSSDSVSPDQALVKLLAGNRNFVLLKPAHPHETRARRAEVAMGQHPIAVIVGCSDSRVPPELLFDQGEGDLFIVRVAGNIVDDVVLGSIEFGVMKLGARLVMVLGHERCGAINATVKGGEAPGHIRNLIEAIAPSVAAARTEPGDLAENAMRLNVKRMVKKIKETPPILKELIEKGTVKVVGARYDLDDGSVSIYDLEK
ncbi:MAG: carbonic anhydrase [Candidatus Ozemobacteraceae bacterium]